MINTKISIPTVLQVGKGTLGQLGKVLADNDFKNVVLYYGNGLIKMFGETVSSSLNEAQINVLEQQELDSVDIDDIIDIAFKIDNAAQVIVAIGGGKVIDAGKYAAYLRKLPYISIPTSASSDGFSSASASLIVNGRRTSVPAAMAYGIVVDTDVLKSAPERFIYSGIGDMVSKITSLYDWVYEASLGYSQLNDFSVMIAKKAVNSFVRTPFESIKDDLFLKELVDSLAMSGIANEIAGGSAPTSGSEHLISHALDKMLEQPALHGVQVGIATYIMAKVQNHRYERVNTIFKKTGFWDFVSTLNLNIKDYEKAIDMAPSIKPHRHTYLHEEKYRELAKKVLYEDEVLQRVFRGEKAVKYEALLFDLDGTMWDATENIRESWNLAIKDFDELKGKVLTKEDLEKVMGLPMNEIAARLFPELDTIKQLQVLEHCCEIENDFLAKEGGTLYPKLEETLKALSEKVKLCIVSNGQAGYIQSFLTFSKLDKYFSDIQNWGDNKVPKGENIKLVMERNGIKNAAYVGDTLGDAKAAEMAGIDFVFARYGFGNVQNYDYVIDRFEQLVDIVK